jgi:hypothetical protein
MTYMQQQVRTRKGCIYTDIKIRMMLVERQESVKKDMLINVIFQDKKQRDQPEQLSKNTRFIWYKGNHGFKQVD